MGSGLINVMLASRRQR